MLNYFAMLLASLRDRLGDGFCYSCERLTSWSDHGVTYRCSNCGHDPLFNRPE